MNPVLNNSPLNAAQQQHLAALAASVSDSPRTVVILLVLAAYRLGLHGGAPRQLGAMNCKQIHQWVNRQCAACSYEATRKLLKNLVDAGCVEFWHGRYILAEGVDASLAKLGASPNPSSGIAATSEGIPGGTGANSSVVTPTARCAASSVETKDEATNKKAVEFLAQLAARQAGCERSALFWSIARCRATSLAHLGAAASGLAMAIMAGAQFVWAPDELQDILDGKSKIRPSSAEAFVFAYEAHARESALEIKAMVQAAEAKAMEPYIIQIRDTLLKHLAPQPTAAAEPSSSSGSAPVTPVEELGHLAPVFQLPLPGDYGDAA